MPEIRGLAVHAAGAELLPYRYKVDEIGPDEVEVRISHCGVCHSDVHLIDNDWGISKYPFIPGHEVIGAVHALGTNVRHVKLGDRVGVGWQADSCGICEWCRSAREHLCPKAQPTCIGRNGGFAEYLRVNWRFVIPIPSGLESENAAPLLCGGITVYNPLRSHGARPSSRVAVVGIGGLGHLGLQFARAFGCEVTAFSTSKDKEAEARALGAHHFVNTRETNTLKKLAGAYDLILSTAAADQDFQAFLNALRPQGTLIVLGSGPKPLQIAAPTLITAQKAVAGSNTGSPSDLAEMLDVAVRHKIKAVTEMYSMKDANKAVASVKQNKARYRAVLAN
jgi:alcohol/geraniol dehydrogenase (NADP+)